MPCRGRLVGHSERSRGIPWQATQLVTGPCRTHAAHLEVCEGIMEQIEPARSRKKGTAARFLRSMRPSHTITFCSALHC